MHSNGRRAIDSPSGVSPKTLPRRTNCVDPRIVEAPFIPYASAVAVCRSSRAAISSGGRGDRLRPSFSFPGYGVHAGATGGRGGTRRGAPTHRSLAGRRHPFVPCFAFFHALPFAFRLRAASGRPTARTFSVGRPSDRFRITDLCAGTTADPSSVFVSISRCESWSIEKARPLRFGAHRCSRIERRCTALGNVTVDLQSR